MEIVKMNKLELTFNKPEELPVATGNYTYDCRREFLLYVDWGRQFPRSRYNWVSTFYNFNEKYFVTKAKVLLWVELPFKDTYCKNVDGAEPLCENWCSFKDCCSCSNTECNNNPGNMTNFRKYIENELGVEDVSEDRLEKLYRSLKPYMYKLMIKDFRLLSHDNFVDADIDIDRVMHIIDIDDWFEIVMYRGESENETN